MREGLRSGKSRERLQKDEGSSGKVLVQKKLFDMVRKVDPCVDVKDAVLESTCTGSVQNVRTEKLDDSGTCGGEGEDVNGCERVEALEYKKKRRREDGDEGSECLGPEKKKVKEEVFDGEVQVGARVLRSRMRSGSTVEEERLEDRVVKVGKKRGRNHKKESKRVKIKEDDESYEPVEKNLKRKRGRPSKASGAAPKRRGRPPLAQGTLGVSRNHLHKKRIAYNLRKSQRILKTKGNLKQGGSTRSSKRGTRVRDEFKSKNPVLCEEVEKSDQEMEASPVRSLVAGNTVSFDEDGATEAGKSEINEDAGLTRASEKQLVRDRIMNLLFHAGWTVDYRPRNRKIYNDAVYVSPDGKTHWSVTLAYRVLKKRYEVGDTRAYKEGFIFSPIPSEELDMLKRVQIKKRNGKKEQKGLKRIGTPDRALAMKKKKKKGEIRSGVSKGRKTLDGRMKRKSLQYERDDSADAHNAPQSSGIRKRRETHKRKRYALLVRRSDNAESDGDGYVLYNGKRTTLAWMIDSGTMIEKAKVSYMNPRKTRAMLQGKIMRDGIDCGCCGEVVTMLEFEAHAGSKLHRPLENIFVENGSSILQYQLDAWNKLESEHKWFHFIDVNGDDPNDDTCGICGDGGNLVCCDGCPSTFHQNCLDIQKFPSGDWYCLYCICKYCGKIGEDTNQMSIEETKRSLLSCYLCEEKYHTSCILADDALKGEPTFCGRKCQEIYSNIEMLLGVNHELENGFSWTLVQRCEVAADISSSEVQRKIECNSKLAVAFSVMDECFLPSSDHRSGVNLIHNILYSCRSNFSRLNFSGFYTVTLEMGDEIVAVASIRIHGNILAEMPYIGTRYMYRRQGMCRRLLTAVDCLLRSLNVAKLVIPAISELTDTWTSVFGFEPLDPSTQRRMRSMNVLVFPGVDMLQKPVLNNGFTGESIVHDEGLITSEGEDHQRVNEAVKVSDSNNIFQEKLDLNIAFEVTDVNDADETEGKPSVLNPAFQLLNVSSNDSSDITSESIDCTNCTNDNISPTQLGEPCDTLESKSGNVGIFDTDCGDWKQAKGIHLHHQSAESDSLPLTSDKSHPQSGGTNSCLGSLPDSVELDGDFTCEVKAGNSPTGIFHGSHSKDSEVLPVDGGHFDRLHDSSTLIGSNGCEPRSQSPNDPDEVLEAKTDETCAQISGRESCNGICPSSTHENRDLLPAGNCEDGHLDCNHSPATSNPDLDLTVSAVMPAMIITHSVRGDSSPLIGSNGFEPTSQSPNDPDEVLEAKTDGTCAQISGHESCNGICPSTTNENRDLLLTGNCEDGHFDCNHSPTTSKPDLDLPVSTVVPVTIITDSVCGEENGMDDASERVIEDVFPAQDHLVCISPLSDLQNLK
ncbi:hypothetical protein CRG98_019001 [Punica granatum]|uniref:PHD-type domain-containing protein n=1 Tax=Punica granatum TaxID=22663 RepID=A0A2I0JW66_PUNGR|nr:hypothetical protein CRG98_019001 [Punica granatum]